MQVLVNNTVSQIFFDEEDVSYLTCGCNHPDPCVERCFCSTRVKSTVIIYDIFKLCNYAVHGKKLIRRIRMQFCIMSFDYVQIKHVISFCIQSIVLNGCNQLYPLDQSLYAND